MHPTKLVDVLRLSSCAPVKFPVVLARRAQRWLLVQEFHYNQACIGVSNKEGLSW
jgi:hypothetical protein